MSGKIRELKRRIKGINTMKQLTKAMELVSTSKYKKHQNLVIMSRPYTAAMESILANIGDTIKDERHPLYLKCENLKTRLIILLGSDRGLCGGYNTAVTKEFKSVFSTNEGVKNTLILIGTKLFEPFSQCEVIERYELPIIEEGLEFCRRFVLMLIEKFLSKEVEEVVLVSTEFISTVSSTVKSETLLPLVDLLPSGGLSSYEIETDSTGLIDGWDIPLLSQVETVLDALLPKYLTVKFYQALLESTASEQASRMRAMQNASQNAKESIEVLNLELNRERQSAITQENSEIIAGAEAIQG